MSRGRSPWTEPLGEATLRVISVRNAKTAPAMPFMVRNDMSGSITSTWENLRWAADPSPKEDPESDLSTSSLCSASASIVSTPSPTPISDSDVLPSTLRESHRNMTCASRMPMYQFQRERSGFNWDLFVQRIKEGLPEKVVHHNEHFRLIDYGGSGSVYATAFKMNNDCDTLAIKVLRNKKTDSIIELPKEFQIMRGLKHNHIVAFVGTISRKGQFAVLMYPVAICNLAEYLKDASESNVRPERREPGQGKTLLTAFGCLSSAVRYLHTTSPLTKHKDIKPENILVNRHGSVLLADFGISKQYEDDTLTEGMTPFTDKYAPPEVVGQDKRDLSSDIFSLGCVFLEIATVILGESLENLSRAVFDKRDRQNYRDFPSKVSNWVSKLKGVAILKAPGYSALSRNHSDKGHQILTNQHLDAVLSMMSKSPADRPSILDVYELFKGFSKLCLECQAGVCSNSSRFRADSPFQRKDARLEQSHSRKPISKIHVLPATLTEAGAIIDQSQPAFQGIPREGSIQDNSWWIDGGHRDPGSLGTPKLPTATATDATENDYSSDAESFCSDFDESERRIVKLKSWLQPLLEANKTFILSYLRNIDGNTDGFRYCPADGSSGSRRQGSQINGPPGKRRAGENRRVLPLPEREGNGESDGEDTPSERRGLNSKGSSPRMWACPFHQRERYRHTNRACKGPGWTEFHRLKEHLVRVHRIYRCPRCQNTFPRKSGLNSHQRQAAACMVRDRVIDDNYDWGGGFDDEQCNKLNSRLRNVDGVEKWKRWYKILFPRDAEEDIPSPYCTDGMAEHISDLTTHISQNISSIVPQELQTELEFAIHASIEKFARQNGVAGDKNVAQVKSLQQPSLMQQPTPERTLMALAPNKITDDSQLAFQLSMPAIERHHNGEGTSAFQPSNSATSTTDTVWFSNELVNDSSGYPSKRIEQVPDGLSFEDTFDWTFGQDDDVSLDDLQPYLDAGDMQSEEDFDQ